MPARNFVGLLPMEEMKQSPPRIPTYRSTVCLNCRLILLTMPLLVRFVPNDVRETRHENVAPFESNNVCGSGARRSGMALRRRLRARGRSGAGIAPELHDRWRDLSRGMSLSNGRQGGTPCAPAAARV